jgi:hypothetical protein
MDRPASWTLPITHVAAAATFGAIRTGGVMPWAWVIQTHTTATHLLTSAALFTAGTIAWLPDPQHHAEHTDQD